MSKLELWDTGPRQASGSLGHKKAAMGSAICGKLLVDVVGRIAADVSLSIQILLLSCGRTSASQLQFAAVGSYVNR